MEIYTAYTHTCMDTTHVNTHLQYFIYSLEVPFKSLLTLITAVNETDSVSVRYMRTDTNTVCTVPL